MASEPRIPCSACHGHGEVELPPPYRYTLSRLDGKWRDTTAVLARHRTPIVQRTALVNRLNALVRERCDACWRAAAARSPGGPALGEALLVVVAEMAERDQERAGLREAARVEMFEQVQRLGAAARAHADADADAAAAIAAVREFAPNQHLTRLDSTSAVIALAEIPRDRDEDLEVDIETEWDLSDVGGGA